MDAKRRKVEKYPPRSSRFQDKVEPWHDGSPHSLRLESSLQLEAVVTGAAGNFGAVCARMMAAEGAKLALVDLVEDPKREVSSLVTGQTAGCSIRGPQRLQRLSESLHS